MWKVNAMMVMQLHPNNTWHVLLFKTENLISYTYWKEQIEETVKTFMPWKNVMGSSESFEMKCSVENTELRTYIWGMS